VPLNRFQQHTTADAADAHFRAWQAERPRQAHSLAAAMFEKLGNTSFGHDNSPSVTPNDRYH
jgi:hypothetical protein